MPLVVNQTVDRQPPHILPFGKKNARGGRYQYADLGETNIDPAGHAYPAGECHAALDG
jgi:hypothetical protein